MIPGLELHHESKNGAALLDPLGVEGDVGYPVPAC